MTTRVQQTGAKRPPRRRVLVLVHEDLVPPEDLTGLSDKEIAKFKCEYDVSQALQQLGHDVRLLGLSDDLAPLRKTIDEWKPHIAFNLLEEFGGFACYDQNVVSYLELRGVHYTGNNARGLILARDKALAKKILHYHRIRTPEFAVFPPGRSVSRRPRHLGFPLIVKSLLEESSTAISQASVVSSEETLAERVAFIHEKVGTPALVEQFIDGRELYVAVLGNRRLEVLPVWELDFGEMPDASYKIATRRLKFNPDYQDKYQIRSCRARGLPEEVEARMTAAAKRIFRLLDLSGYARLDFRLAEDGRFYLLEANPNPDISSDEELAEAAESVGYSYPDLIWKIVRLGLNRPASV